MDRVAERPLDLADLRRVEPHHPGDRQRGRTVGYTYASGRLWKVTDAAGGVTEYTYDTSDRMLTIEDARGITYLTHTYDANGRVATRTQADTGVFEFDCTIWVRNI
jgi:YD repeat-containing protein